MSVLCAVDAGLGAFKYLVAGQTTCGLLDAVLAPPRRMGFGDTPHLVIKHDGVETVVGADARTCRGVRDCWAGGKISPDVRLLMLTALGLLARGRNQHALGAKLATALPVGLWETHREELCKLLTGTHLFSLNGNPYVLEVELTPEHVIPEPYGSYLHMRSLGYLRDEVVGVIDVGHSTVDFALVDGNGNFLAQHSTHADLGAHVFYQIVDESFSSMTGFYPGLPVIENPYITGQTEYTTMGSKYSLTPIFKQARLHYGQRVLGEMQSLWKGLPLDRLLLTGGGATTVLPVFSSVVANKLTTSQEAVERQARSCEGLLMLCPDARKANALGIALWHEKVKDLAAA